MLLSTLTRVKTLLEETDSVYDALLTQFLTGVSAAAENYLQRRVEETTWTDTFTPEKSERVFNLSGFPVVSITTVEYEGVSYEYVIDTRTGILSLKTGIPVVYSYGVLEVVYIGGMGSDVDDFVSNYADIAGAVDMQTAMIFQRRKSLGAQTLSDPGGSVTIDSPVRLTSEVKSILQQHVSVGF